MASVAYQPNPRQEWVAERLRQIDVSELDLWEHLDVLSTHTRVEAVEIPTEGVVIGSNGSFSAVLNLYVILEYGKGDDGFTTSDSFLGRISGQIVGEELMIEASSVDTSSFYE